MTASADTTARPRFSLSREDIPCARERKLAFYWQLGYALRDLGCDTDSDASGDYSYLYEYLYQVHVREDEKKGYWANGKTNKLRAKVGDYGNVKQFPEPNKGFDVEKIAAYLKDARDRRVKEHLYKTASANKHAANKNTLKALAMDFGIDEPSYGTAYLKKGRIEAKEYGFEVKLPTMDEAKLRKALTVLFEAGILEAK